MNVKLPNSVYNWISLIGGTIALISLFMIIFLFSISLFFLDDVSYIGLVIYILLPVIMICGLLLIPFGMILKARKDKKNKKASTSEWPQIDLNNLQHRNAFLIFSIGTTIFLFISALGSYEAFHYTESVEFCGLVCHKVMEPEYTAYQISSHARVACVDCHVGSGADWYVKSKISGLYQVYAVLADNYPRPIPTPIENLRPARETCEECHWPQKFYSQKLRLERHFLNDEDNTQWDISLIMKIGAEHAALGLIEGIHWHINPQIKVEYIASDIQREEIPWVRLINLETGDTTIYQDEENTIDSEIIVDSNIRVMDCIDCHTRPSHNYKPPVQFVNDAMTAGTIPKNLPGIKSLSMEICEEEFSSTDSALIMIEEIIKSFYESEYPEIFENNYELVARATTGLQEAYKQNIFPEMKVKWDVYPNHIGHVEFNGCFRCHSDRHVSEDDAFISKDCNLCHIINAQGEPDSLITATAGNFLEFFHPGDIDAEDWQDALCTDCHTGLTP